MLKLLRTFILAFCGGGLLLAVLLAVLSPTGRGALLIGVLVAAAGWPLQRWEAQRWEAQRKNAAKPNAR